MRLDVGGGALEKGFVERFPEKKCSCKNSFPFCSEKRLSKETSSTTSNVIGMTRSGSELKTCSLDDRFTTWPPLLLTRRQFDIVKCLTKITVVLVFPFISHATHLTKSYKRLAMNIR